MTWVHRCMIVPADQVELARNLCATLAGAGGDGMFTTPLSADGSYPASHYISSGLIEDGFANLLPLRTVTEYGDLTTLPGHPDQVTALAAEAGITVDPVAIATLYAAVDISDDEPMQALARLGLGMAQEQEAQEP